MKKTTRKLTLSRETLYQLADSSLKKAAGGYTYTQPTHPPNCNTDACPTVECDTNISACAIC
jgi:hypothetical protein